MQNLPAANSARPTVASLWIGSGLSWVEVVCIQSFLDAGHHFVLYTRGAIGNIPEGVEQRRADDLTPPTTELRDRKEIAAFSNFFRFRMLQTEDFIWVDLDVYCVKPFDFDTDWIFAIEMASRDRINTGVLALPKDAVELQQCIDFWQTPNAIPPWFPRNQRRPLRELRMRGEAHTLESLRWGTSGPHLLDHFLRQSGNIQHAMPRDTFYPTSGQDFALTYTSGVTRAEIEKPQTYSVHLYGEVKRRLLADHNGLPPEGSYLELICVRHEVDPRDFPIKEIPRLDGAMPADIDPAPGTPENEMLDVVIQANSDAD